MIEVHELNQADEIARQLRCPSGRMAMETAENMFASNVLMIFKTIDSLHIEDGNTILETGFGNGKHLPYLFGKATNLKYDGIDISEEMVAAARSNNHSYTSAGRAAFHLIDANAPIPFPNEKFNRFFSVNTIYFWPDVSYYLHEIHRVLKPGGKMTLGFVDKSFGEKLPFTQTGFNFYEAEEIEKLAREAGFKHVGFILQTDTAVSKDGREVARPYYVLDADV